MSAQPRQRITFRLDARRALITGGSRGIGAAVARAFAEAGARVAISYRSSSSDAMTVLDSLPGMGHVAIQTDVADPEAVQRLVAEAEQTLGGIDILVNNAGIYEMQPFLGDDYADWLRRWARTLDTNLMGAANAAYCVLPGMVRQGYGRIINIASRAAFRGETDAPAYAASKAGMVALTRCLARALGPKGIVSSCIAPGWVETAMAREGIETMAVSILSEIPLGRIASVEDVAAVALFLASDAASYLNGVVIDVNGGSYLR